jgi:hypothetical protein
MEQLSSHWTDIQEIWYLKIFQLPVEKNSSFIQSNKNKGYFTWRPTYFSIISRSFLRTMTSVSDKSCSENQNTHSVFSNYFWKIVPFMRKVGKVLCSGAGHRQQCDNIRLQILTAFLLQQLLHECTSMLCYMHIACHFICKCKKKLPPL